MTDDDEPETDAERVVRMAAFNNLSIACAFNNSYGHHRSIENIDGMKFYHCPDGSAIGTRRTPKTPGLEYHPARLKHRNFVLDIWTTKAETRA